MTEDIDALSLNTAISQMMIFINEVYKVGKVNKTMFANFVKLLAPIAPHISEEMYSELTGEETLTYAAWPTYDESKLQVMEKEIAVQVNGKLRGKFVASTEATDDELYAKALEQENVQKYIEGKEIRKHFVIKGKVVNIVV